MPKTYLSDADRALARFRRWFHDEKNRHDVNQADVAKRWGMTQQSVSQKLQVKGSSQTEITLRQAIILFDMMNATDEEILRLMRIKGG